jgi:mRNA interferase MazF
LRIEPDARNGLRMASRLIVDKITTVPRTKLRNRIGSLADEDILKLNRAILVFLGIAAPVSA